MTGRTLTGSATTTPQTRPTFPRDPEGHQGEPEAHMWGLLATLWTLGSKRALLDTEAERLGAVLANADAWLAVNPNHPDIADYRRRLAAAQERHRTMLDEIDGIDVSARLLLQGLTATLSQLTPRRLAALRKLPGWSKAHSPVRISWELWEAAKARSPMPAGEPGF